MDKPRTLRGLHAGYTQASCVRNPPTRSLRTLEGWYRTKDWKLRAEAYDNDQSEILLQQLSERQQHEALERVDDFSKLARNSGRAGVILSSNLKVAIANFMASGFEIRTLEEADRAARIVRAIEPSSFEMLATSIGVTKMLDEYGEE